MRAISCQWKQAFHPTKAAASRTHSRTLPRLRWPLTESHAYTVDQSRSRQPPSKPTSAVYPTEAESHQLAQCTCLQPLHPDPVEAGVLSGALRAEIQSQTTIRDFHRRRRFPKTTLCRLNVIDHGHPLDPDPLPILHMTRIAHADGHFPATLLDRVLSLITTSREDKGTAQ